MPWMELILMDIEAWSGPFERAIELEDELAWHGKDTTVLYI